MQCKVAMYVVCRSAISSLCIIAKQLYFCRSQKYITLLWADFGLKKTAYCSCSLYTLLTVCLYTEKCDVSKRCCTWDIWVYFRPLLYVGCTSSTRTYEHVMRRHTELRIWVFRSWVTGLAIRLFWSSLLALSDSQLQQLQKSTEDIPSSTTTRIAQTPACVMRYINLLLLLLLLLLLYSGVCLR